MTARCAPAVPEELTAHLRARIAVASTPAIRP